MTFKGLENQGKEIQDLS